MILTALIGLGLPLLGGGLLVGAAVAYFYVPLIGRALAVGLIACGAGVFSYDAGYRERAALDQSVTLQVEIQTLKSNTAELRRQADATNRVLSSANEAELTAENRASAIQEKVTAYEIELAKRPSGECALSDSDVGRLRGIGAAGRPVNPPKPTDRPLDIRPIGDGS